MDMYTIIAILLIVLVVVFGFAVSMIKSNTIPIGIALIIIFVLIMVHGIFNNKTEVISFKYKRNNILTTIEENTQLFLLGKGADFISNDIITIDVSDYDSRTIRTLLKNGYFISDSTGNKLTVDPVFVYPKEVDEFNRNLSKYLEKHNKRINHWFFKIYYPKEVFDLKIID